MTGQFTLQEFLAANPGSNRSQYVHMLVNHTAWGKDAVESILENFYPTLCVKEGMVLVESIGAVPRYEQFRRSGQAPIDAQKWANLFPISETYGHSVDIGEIIRKSWSSAATRQFPNLPVTVEVSTDFDPDEVVVMMRNA